MVLFLAYKKDLSRMPWMHWVAMLTIPLGYPAAYILSQKQFNTSRTMVVLFILPMWVNILIRTLATCLLYTSRCV